MKPDTWAVDRHLESETEFCPLETKVCIEMLFLESSNLSQEQKQSGAGGVAQLEEFLPDMHDALGLVPSTM